LKGGWGRRKARAKDTASRLGTARWGHEGGRKSLVDKKKGPKRSAFTLEKGLIGGKFTRCCKDEGGRANKTHRTAKNGKKEKGQEERGILM